MSLTAIERAAPWKASRLGRRGLESAGEQPGVAIRQNHSRGRHLPALISTALVVPASCQYRAIVVERKKVPVCVFLWFIVVQARRSALQATESSKLGADPRTFWGSKRRLAGPFALGRVSQPFWVERHGPSHLADSDGGIGPRSWLCTEYEESCHPAVPPCRPGCLRWRSTVRHRPRNGSVPSSPDPAGLPFWAHGIVN